MDYDADVVFLGDSITSGGDFSKYFPEKRVVNMGIPGDSLFEMLNRVEMIDLVNLEKVFVLGGINSLTDRNSTVCLTWYENMIVGIQDSTDAEIYIQSILPISKGKEDECADNEVIRDFNKSLEILAEKYGCAFIDLYSLYEKERYMNPDLTKDGIYLLTEAYDIWAGEISKYVLE